MKKEAIAAESMTQETRQNLIVTLSTAATLDNFNLGRAYERMLMMGEENALQLRPGAGLRNSR